MKNLKLTLFTFFFSIFLINCQNEKNNLGEETLNINKQNNFVNISNINKTKYLTFSNSKKMEFKKVYLESFRSGGCSCSAGNGSNCEVHDCPAKTKPKCQDLGGRCDCSCEPYGELIHAYFYNNTIVNDDILITKKQNFDKLIELFKNSGISNADKIINVIKEIETAQKSKNKVSLKLNDYLKQTASISQFVNNLTPEDIFKIEFEL